jgi:CHASE1-domain containing sensor protein
MSIVSRRHSLLWKWTTISFVVGLLVSYSVTVRVEQSNQNHIENVLATQSQDLIQQIYNRVELYQYGLRGLRGTVATAQDSLSRELVERYSDTRDLELEFPVHVGLELFAGFLLLMKHILSKRQHWITGPTLTFAS